MLDHAMIDTFVMPANDDKMRCVREKLRHRLIETAASGRHQDYLRFVRAGLALIFDFRFQLSTAAKIGSGFITIPCPPPNGASSTT